MLASSFVWDPILHGYSYYNYIAATNLIATTVLMCPADAEKRGMTGRHRQYTMSTEVNM